LTEMQIYWLGLQNDREKTIFMEAFWFGVNATDDLKRQVIKSGTNWLVEGEKV